MLVCRQYKESALHYSAKFGQLSAAIYLVEQADAQINAQNDVWLLRYIHYKFSITVEVAFKQLHVLNKQSTLGVISGDPGT